MGNDNSDVNNRLANSNVETKEQNKLKAGADEDTNETGFKRVPINVNDESKQKDLIDLSWYLGIANAVYTKQTIKISKLINGKKVGTDVQKSVFSHFEFPSVGEQPFTEWVKEKFGADVKVDSKTKEVYTLVPEGDNAPTPQPNVNNQTEETQPQPAPEQNTNDPENN